MRLGRRWGELVSDEDGPWDEGCKEFDCALSRVEERMLRPLPATAHRLAVVRTPVAAAADAAEACVRGVAPGELPREGEMELGMVCSPESSKGAGRPMKKTSRADGGKGGG